MSEGYSELSYLKRRAHTLRCGLHQRLEEIAAGDFPTDTPKLIINLIQNILNGFEQKINDSESAQIIGLICRVIMYYGEFLPFLDHAHTHQTPRGLVCLLDDIITKLNPEAKLLVWPQSEYNYTIRDIIPTLKKTISNIFSSDEQINLFSELSEPLNLISFPRIERDDILVHAVFGHEIGHPIADKYLAGEELEDSYRDKLLEANNKIDTLLKDRLPKTVTKIERIEAKKNLVKEVEEIRRRGIEELVSDSVAIMTFGPSALFALYDILIIDNLDTTPGSTDYYPPVRKRLRNMKKLMDKLGYTEVLNNLNKYGVDNDIAQSIVDYLFRIDELINSSSDINSIKKKPILDIAYMWLDETLVSASEFAQKEVACISFDVKTIAAEIPELIKRLHLDLPPNEIGAFPQSKAVNWRSAILASWIFKIGGVKKINDYDISLTSNDIELIQKTTLRAIEYIILTTKYNAHINHN